MTVLDAGCGHGRNLVYLLREGYAVFGVDANPEAIAEVRHLAAALAPTLPAKLSRRGHRSHDLSDAFFDVVLLNAVLHFAQSDVMLEGLLQATRRR